MVPLSSCSDRGSRDTLRSRVAPIATPHDHSTRELIALSVPDDAGGLIVGLTGEMFWNESSDGAE